MQARSIPLDTLRGLAVLLMLEVHLGYWWSRGLSGDDPLVGLGTALGGMAAPLFFTIGGAGLALSRRGNPEGFEAKNILRGAALLGAGLVFTLTERAVYGSWGWGVLQSLGVSAIICTPALRASPAARAGAGVALMAAAPVLRHAAGIPDVLFLDSMMAVTTPSGYMSSALLSGFFPLIPWTGFMLLGTVAGELTFARGTDPGGVLGIAKTSSFRLASLAAFMLAAGAAGAAGGMPMEFFPPSLAFCLLASGLCICAVAVSGYHASRSPSAGWAAPLAATGRLSLTLFVAHHILGHDAFSAAGLLYTFGTSQALGMVLLAWVIAAAAAVLWSRKGFCFSLEWLLARMAAGASK